MHTNPGRPVLKINWNRYQTAIDDLVKSINKLKETDDLRCITGIPKGGIIPAIHLSNLTGLEYIDFYSIFPTYNSGNIIIIDDICDSGHTLLQAIKRLLTITKGKAKVSSACLYLRTKSCVVPTEYYQLISDEWIQFPWEPS